MIKANFHMHTMFSDGKNNHEDCVLAAIEKGFSVIGFSDHVPVSIANDWSMKVERIGEYFDEITKLKQKYAKQIEIYAGLEMDYLVTESKNVIMEYVSRVDYTIGTVHYLYDQKSRQYYIIDGAIEEVAKTFAIIGSGDNRRCVAAYYLELIRVIREYQPHIVGHLDIIKRRNQGDVYFNTKEQWYGELIDKVLDTIRSAGVIVEINTGALLYNSLQETYPADWILKKCHQRNIPIILNSDAHQAKDIDGFFNEAISILKSVGYTQQKILRAGRWVDTALF